MKPGLIIDMFAGGGGASVGIEMALGRHVDYAINHDPEAIRMHMVNHPKTVHLTEDVFTVDLAKIVNGRHVSLLWASPDCTHFSKAKGGTPKRQEIRMLPFAVVKHAAAIKPDVIIMENVEEIQQWGPLNESGYPIKEKMGETYHEFLKSMEALGYKHDSRVLVAADYGAPTTRKRWYAIFRCDGEPIRWPKETHNRYGTFGFKQWVKCGRYIDWSDLGTSIFERKKPLADATMKRIANGFVKYVVNDPMPYIVKDKEAYAFLIQYHSEQADREARGQTLSEPIKTIDTSNRYGLVTAFITKFYKTGIGQSCEEPLHTITTSPGHFGLVSAFLIKYYGTGENAESLKCPLATITTKDRFGLVGTVLDVKDEQYVLKDIFLRMLKPEELKLMQGFPKDYIIDRDINWKPYPIKEQVAKIGNSVVPVMSKEIVSANCLALKRGERIPNITVVNNREGQLRMVI